MTLLQRGDEFSIKVGHDELMNSRVHGSEDAMSVLSCQKVLEIKILAF